MEGIFSFLSGYILMKLITFTQYWVHMTPMTFQGHHSWVQRSRSQTLFCTLPAEDTDQWFAVKDRVVILCIY